MSRVNQAPDAEVCLTTSRVSKGKGGTLIAEAWTDPVEYAAAVSDANTFRPPRCLRCGWASVYVHQWLTRFAKAHPTIGRVKVIVFRCAHDETCGATWRVLPAFLARHLHRAWQTVEEEAMDDAPPLAEARNAPAVPKRTVDRWRDRLMQTARFLVVLLSVAGGEVAEVSMHVELDGTRAELVVAHAACVGAAPGQRLEPLAVLAHRLERGIRLM